jgi:hypothetical protein
MMSNLEKFAWDELEREGWFGVGSDFNGMLGVAVMELMKAFAEQGHSGGSAPTVIALFAKLANGEPLSPLTGEDDEWEDRGDGYLQNRRCSRVIKHDGVVFDVDGFVFERPDGTRYTNSSKSRRAVTFPYTPKTEIVKVDE